MVTRRVTKSCCGKNAVVIQVDKPVRKQHVSLFTEAGFVVPESYVNCGLLYAKKGGMIGTATFGIRNVNVRCGGNNCDAIMNEFESILIKIENELE
jgi:hypothetical protein